MHHPFTLHEDSWFSRNPDLRETQVTGFRIGGMPDGRTARIVNFGAPDRNDWRVMKMDLNNSQPEWAGSYGSFEEALEALQTSQ